MFEITAKSVPPKLEKLGVVHKLSSRGEYVDEEALWDGESWTRCNRDGTLGEKVPLNYYYLWRRLET